MMPSRDTEFEQVKKEFEDLKSGAQGALSDVRSGLETEMRELDDVNQEIDDKWRSDDAAPAQAKPLDPDQEMDWLEEHNRAILSAEQEMNPDAGATVPANDTGAAIESDETDAKSEQESAKAGAAT